MGTSPGREVVPWLYEGVAIGWEIEAFGNILDNRPKWARRNARIWDDPNDWIKLLTREVRKKNDEEFVFFWQKDAASIAKSTLVKAWSLVQYLTRDSDEKTRFLRFIGMVQRGRDQAKALKEIYNLSPLTLDREWRKWIKQQRSRKNR